MGNTELRKSGGSLQLLSSPFGAQCIRQTGLWGCCGAKGASLAPGCSRRGAPHPLALSESAQVACKSTRGRARERALSA